MTLTGKVRPAINTIVPKCKQFLVKQFFIPDLSNCVLRMEILDSLKYIMSNNASCSEVH